MGSGGFGRPLLIGGEIMVRVRMRRTVLNGFTVGRDRLERGVVYELPADQAKAFVPRYADYVDGPPAEDEDDTDLDQLTVAQLKELAAKLGVELTGTKKADIVDEVEAAMAAAHQAEGE